MNRVLYFCLLVLGCLTLGAFAGVQHERGEGATTPRKGHG